MSNRLATFLLGSLATGIALLCRLGGLFQDWDANLFHWLGLSANHAVFPLWLDLTCVPLFVFGTVIISRQVSSPIVRVGLLAVTLLQPISATAVGLVAGLGVSPYTWLTGMLVAVIGVGLYGFSAVGKRDQLLRELFGKQLSSGAIQKLSREPDALLPKTVRATILHGRYTGDNWSKNEAMLTQLRETEAWVEMQGGNYILAVWNSPVTLGSPAMAAVEATLGRMTDWMAGLVTGEIRVERLEATGDWQMRGEAFDKAAALCQANMVYGTHLLVDLETADAVEEDFVLRPVDLFIQPGNDLGMEIFEPISSRNMIEPNLLTQRDQFWSAVILFRQKRYAEALAAFQKSGNDPVVQYYLKRLEKLTTPS